MEDNKVRFGLTQSSDMSEQPITSRSYSMPTTEQHSDTSNGRKYSRRESQQGIIRTAAELNQIVKGLLDEPRKKDSEIIKTGFSQLTVFTGALDRILKYLNESPLGEKMSHEVEKFVWNAIEDLSAIEVGVAIAYLSLVIGFHFMFDARPNQYQAKVKGIEERIDHIKMEIQNIMEKSNHCLALLQDIIKIETAEDNEGESDIVLIDESKLNQLENLFREEIRLAKLGLRNCDSWAKANENSIKEVLEEVKGHLMVAGGVKAALIVAGLYGLQHVYQSQVREKKIMIAIGVAGVSIFWLLSSVPRYTNIQDEFKNYRVRTMDLRVRLDILQKEIESHEEAFKEQLERSRARTESGSTGRLRNLSGGNASNNNTPNIK